MTRKIYRSAQGRPVNFDELIANNPNTIAAGNANLNSRGDIIGPGGKIIKTAEEIAMEGKSTIVQKKVSINKDIEELKKSRMAWKEQFVDVQADGDDLDLTNTANLIQEPPQDIIKEDDENVLSPAEALKLIPQSQNDKDNKESKPKSSSKRKIVETDE